MRQLSPITNLMLACLAALGLSASLSLPWYAPARASADADAGTIGDVHGPLETVFQDLADVFTGAGSTVSGAEMLNAGEAVLMGFGGVTVIFSLLLVVGVLRPMARELLRIVPIAAPAAVLFHAIDHPAPGLELRWGLLASTVIAAFMASAAWQGSQMLEPKKRPAPYVPPAPPAGSAPPPA